MHFKVQTEQSRADEICLSSILKNPRSPPPLVPQPIPVIVSLKPSSSPSPGLAYESLAPSDCLGSKFPCQGPHVQGWELSHAQLVSAALAPGLHIREQVTRQCPFSWPLLLSAHAELLQYLARQGGDMGTCRNVRNSTCLAS